MAQQKSGEFDWAGDSVEVMELDDLVDKAELVDVPFRIDYVWFTQNARDIEYVYLDVFTKEGAHVTFNDSSTTGVRAQIEEHLRTKGITPKLDGEKHPLRVLCPRGLRVSRYEITDERNRTRQAKTYYLTGQKAPDAPKPATPKPTAKKATSPAQ